MKSDVRRGQRHESNIVKAIGGLMEQARPGEIYSFRILGGGYGAAQVIAAKPGGSGNWLRLLRLDVDSALPPEPSEVAASAAETAISNELDCLWVPAFVPWWAQRIGDAPVRPRAGSERYGAWEFIVIRALVARMTRAGHQVPAWSHDREPVVVDLGGRPGEMRRDSSSIDTRDLLPDVATPVNWQGLSALLRITDLTHEGADRGLLETARRLPFPRHLTWRLPQADMIDLQDTQLLEVDLLAVDRPLTVLLPPTAFALTLDGRYNLVTLDVPDLSEAFWLTLSDGTSSGLPKRSRCVASAAPPFAADRSRAARRIKRACGPYLSRRAGGHRPYRRTAGIEEPAQLYRLRYLRVWCVRQPRP